MNVQISNDTTVSESRSSKSLNMKIETGGNLTIYKCNVDFGPGPSFDVSVATGVSFSIVESNITVWTCGIETNQGASIALEGSCVSILGTRSTLTLSAWTAGLQESTGVTS